MTVNHGVPGSSPGEGAKKAFVNYILQGFFVFKPFGEILLFVDI